MATMANNMATLRVLNINCWDLPYSKDLSLRVPLICKVLEQNDREAHRHTPLGAPDAILETLPIHDRGYDIIGMEEVFMDADQKAFIKAGKKGGLTYSHYFRSGMGFPGIPRGGHPSGLLLLSRYPIKEAMFHRYSLNGKPHKLLHWDWHIAKGVGLCRVITPFGSIDVYLSHLVAAYTVSKDDCDEYLCDRVAQAYECVKFMKSTRASPLAILLCDLNAMPGSLPYRILTHIGEMEDSFTKANDFQCRETERISMKYITHELEKRYVNIDADIKATITGSTNIGTATDIDTATKIELPNIELHWEDLRLDNEGNTCNTSVYADGEPRRVDYIFYSSKPPENVPSTSPITFFNPMSELTNSTTQETSNSLMPFTLWKNILEKSLSSILPVRLELDPSNSHEESAPQEITTLNGYEFAQFLQSLRIVEPLPSRRLSAITKIHDYNEKIKLRFQQGQDQDVETESKLETELKMGDSDVFDYKKAQEELQNCKPSIHQVCYGVVRDICNAMNVNFSDIHEEMQASFTKRLQHWLTHASTISAATVTTPATPATPATTTKDESVVSSNTSTTATATSATSAVSLVKKQDNNDDSNQAGKDLTNKPPMQHGSIEKLNFYDDSLDSVDTTANHHSPLAHDLSTYATKSIKTKQLRRKSRRSENLSTGDLYTSDRDEVENGAIDTDSDMEDTERNVITTASREGYGNYESVDDCVAKYDPICVVAGQILENKLDNDHEHDYEYEQGQRQEDTSTSTSIITSGVSLTTSQGLTTPTIRSRAGSLSLVAFSNYSTTIQRGNGNGNEGININTNTSGSGSGSGSGESNIAIDSAPISTGSTPTITSPITSSLSSPTPILSGNSISSTLARQSGHHAKITPLAGTNALMSVIASTTPVKSRPHRSSSTTSHFSAMSNMSNMSAISTISNVTADSDEECDDDDNDSNINGDCDEDEDDTFTLTTGIKKTNTDNKNNNNNNKNNNNEDIDIANLTLAVTKPPMRTQSHNQSLNSSPHEFTYSDDGLATPLQNSAIFSHKMYLDSTASGSTNASTTGSVINSAIRNNTNATSMAMNTNTATNSTHQQFLSPLLSPILIAPTDSISTVSNAEFGTIAVESDQKDSKLDFKTNDKTKDIIKETTKEMISQAHNTIDSPTTLNTTFDVNVSDNANVTSTQAEVADASTTELSTTTAVTTSPSSDNPKYEITSINRFTNGFKDTLQEIYSELRVYILRTAFYLFESESITINEGEIAAYSINSIHSPYDYSTFQDAYVDKNRIEQLKNLQLTQLKPKSGTKVIKGMKEMSMKNNNNILPSSQSLHLHHRRHQHSTHPSAFCLRSLDDILRIPSQYILSLSSRRMFNLYRLIPREKNINQYRWVPTACDVVLIDPVYYHIHPKLIVEHKKFSEERTIEKIRKYKLKMLQKQRKLELKRNAMMVEKHNRKVERRKRRELKQNHHITQNYSDNSTVLEDNGNTSSTSPSLSSSKNSEDEKMEIFESFKKFFQIGTNNIDSDTDTDTDVDVDADTDTDTDAETDNDNDDTSVKLSDRELWIHQEIMKYKHVSPFEKPDINLLRRNLQKSRDTKLSSNNDQIVDKNLYTEENISTLTSLGSFNTLYLTDHAGISASFCFLPQNLTSQHTNHGDHSQGDSRQSTKETVESKSIIITSSNTKISQSSISTPIHMSGVQPQSQSHSQRNDELSSATMLNFPYSALPPASSNSFTTSSHQNTMTSSPHGTSPLSYREKWPSEIRHLVSLDPTQYNTLLEALLSTSIGILSAIHRKNMHKVRLLRALSTIFALLIITYNNVFSITSYLPTFIIILVFTLVGMYITGEFYCFAMFGNEELSALYNLWYSIALEAEISDVCSPENYALHKLESIQEKMKLHKKEKKRRDKEQKKQMRVHGMNVEQREYVEQKEHVEYAGHETKTIGAHNGVSAASVATVTAVAVAAAAAAGQAAEYKKQEDAYQREYDNLVVLYQNISDFMFHNGLPLNTLERLHSTHVHSNVTDSCALVAREELLIKKRANKYLYKQ